MLRGNIDDVIYTSLKNVETLELMAATPLEGGSNVDHVVKSPKKLQEMDDAEVDDQPAKRLNSTLSKSSETNRNCKKERIIYLEKLIKQLRKENNLLIETLN